MASPQPLTLIVGIDIAAQNARRRPSSQWLPLPAPAVDPGRTTATGWQALHGRPSVAQGGDGRNDADCHGGDRVRTGKGWLPRCTRRAGRSVSSRPPASASFARARLRRAKTDAVDAARAGRLTAGA